MAQIVDYVSNWAARLQGRLMAQFKDDPSWNLWCTAVLGPQAQALEDAFQTLLALLNVDGAVGNGLDVIGRIVGQPRSAGVSQDDVTYRLYLKARIAANRSEGDPVSIYNVFTLLFPGQALRISSSPIKAFTLTIGGVITAAQAATALTMLLAAKEATDYAVMEWQQAIDPQMFTTAVATFCKVATAPGVNSMRVDPRPFLSGLWPAAGQVLIDGGLATAETIAYSAIAGNLISFGANTTQAHAVNAELELVGDPGLGWGDNTNPATGGQLAGAGVA